MKHNERITQALCAWLHDGDEADRCHASRALAELRDPAAVPDLITCLADPDPDVCVDAAEALGRIGAPESVSPLIASINSEPDGEYLAIATRTLGMLDDTRAREQLISLLKAPPAHLESDASEDWDDWWDIQREAVIGLAQTPAPGAIHALLDLLDDPEHEDLEAELFRALIKSGPEGELAVAKRTRTGGTRSRRRAITALGEGQGKGSLDVLGRALLGNDAGIRIAAIEALAKRGAKRYLRAVLLLLRDSDARIRAAAAGAIDGLARGREGGDFSVSALIPLLNDQSRDVQIACMKAIGHIPECGGEQAVKRIKKALSSRDSQLVTAACETLGKLGAQAPVTDLLAIASDPKHSATARRAALLAIGGSAIWNGSVSEVLSAAIDDDEQIVRLAALAALMKLAATADSHAGENPSGPRSPHAVLFATLAGKTVREPLPVEVATPPGPQTATAPAPAPAQQDAPERPGAQSTLQAIALDNAEVAEQLRRADAGDAGDADPVTEPREELEPDPFVDIVAANYRNGDWMADRGECSKAVDVRRMAARLLGDLDHAGATAVLIKALGDSDRDVRTQAARSLSRQPVARPATTLELDSDGAQQALMTMLTSDDLNEKMAALTALSVLFPQAAEPILRSTCKSPEPLLRANAVAAFSGLFKNASPDQDDESMLAWIQEMLADDYPGTRLAAANVAVDWLSSIGPDRAAAYRSALLDTLLAAAYAQQGAQAAQIGALAAAVDAVAAQERVLAQLPQLTGSESRQTAFELLVHISNNILNSRELH